MKIFCHLKQCTAPMLVLLASLAGVSPLACADSSVAYELTLEAAPEAAPQLEQSARSSEGASQAPPEQARNLKVKRKRSAVGSVQRQRKPTVSAEQLLVIAYDSKGKEVFRTAIQDPRIIRAEFLGDDQQHAESTRVIRSDAPLNFTLPDDPSIIRIDILQPSWEGKRMQLQTIGSVLTE